MKRNLYDIFDHYNGDLQQLPELKGQPLDTKSLTDKVFEKADIHPVQKKRRSYRLLGIAAAAAVLVGGTLTAGAVSGKMDEFFKSISKADIYDAVPKENLPAVNEELTEAVAEMESFYSCPDVSFTQTDSGKVELLGLYNDNSSLMLSFRLTVEDGTVLTDDMKMLPYFDLTQKDGAKKELCISGYTTNPFQKSETEDNVYYLTYYMVDPELAGGTLHVNFAGVYTSAQDAAVHEKMLALDEELREKYFTEDMEVGEWKKFQHENDFDELRSKTRREAYEAEESALSGGWSADIPIPAAKSEPVTIETGHNTYILDELSVYRSYEVNEDYYSDDHDYSKESYLDTAVFLKDGTVIANEFSMFDDVGSDEENKYVLEGTRYKQFAYLYGTASAGSDVCDGRVSCYSRPVSIDEIDKVVEYTYYLEEDGTMKYNEYVIYQ